MTSSETLSRSATRAPHPALRSLVEDYHGYRITDVPPGIHHGLPTRALTMVIALDDPLELGWWGHDHTRRRFWSVASGLTTTPAAISHEGRQAGIQVGLTPQGARTLFGVPAGALSDQLLPLGDVIGPVERRLYDAVASAGDWEQRFEALDRELLRLRSANRDVGGTTRSELAWAWRRLGRDVGSGTVGRLASEIGWSRRHLAEQFRREYGVTPKGVARIARFERSRTLMVHGVSGRQQLSSRALSGMSLSARISLSDVAAMCGYADQAHLTREWQALSGYTPTQWLREELPFVQDLQEQG